MSKNRSVATEKPEGRFANGACELAKLLHKTQKIC